MVFQPGIVSPKIFDMEWQQHEQKNERDHIFLDGKFEEF
jgi:hypothetical protein